MHDSICLLCTPFLQAQCHWHALVNCKEFSPLPSFLLVFQSVCLAHQTLFILLKVHNLELRNSTVPLTICRSTIYFIRAPRSQFSEQYCFSSAYFIYRGFSLPFRNGALSSICAHLKCIVTLAVCLQLFVIIHSCLRNLAVYRYTKTGNWIICL